MKIKLTTTLLFCLLLISCSSVSGYKYNEEAAKIYFEESEAFEALYSNLSDGTYDGDQVQLKEDIENLELVTKETMGKIDSLTPPEDAEQFHAKIQEYIKSVDADFIKELNTYADLSDGQQRDSVLGVICELYSDISDVENEMQKEQAKFAKKIGLKLE